MAAPPPAPGSGWAAVTGRADAVLPGGGEDSPASSPPRDTAEATVLGPRARLTARAAAGLPCTQRLARHSPDMTRKPLRRVREMRWVFFFPSSLSEFTWRQKSIKT